jgi:hypothetical protein
MTLAKAKRKRIRKRKSKKVSSVRISLLNLSKYSDDEVWQVVRHVVPSLKFKRHPYIELTVTGCKPNWHHHGGYYEDGATRDDPLVVARANHRDSFYPHRHVPPENWAKQGYQPRLLLDRMESLVDVLAHEFKHAWQYENIGKKRGRLHGVRRNSISEKEADAYAIKTVREWRRLYNHREAYLPPLFFATPSVFDIATTFEPR